jgi:2-haloalkanoic acid dehalogenase type II
LALKAIFLDLGGTLMDLESDGRAHLEMMRAFREEAGLQRPAEELLRRFDELQRERIERLGTSWLPGMDLNEEAVACLLREEGIPVTRGLWEAFRRCHWREHLRWLRPYPEVSDVLRGLRRTRLHMGLLSDVDEDFLQLCMYALPLEDQLDSITTSEEVGKAKPHRAIFQRALSKARCLPHEAVHVGDSAEKDAAGAKGAGMRAILIAMDGEEGAADYVVSSIGEAYEVLLEMAAGGEG